MALDNSSLGKSTGAAADVLDSAVAGVHKVVDRAMDAAAPAAQRYDAVAEFVSENPVKSIAIAFVTGVLVGKIIL